MASSSSRREPGVGVAFRYLADQHLKSPGKINKNVIKDHFTSVTQSSEWGTIGEQLALMLNNPPEHDDMQPIRDLVGKMGFDDAVRALSSDKDADSHQIHAKYEEIERQRQLAFEPIAALIDSSEWAEEDKATFYEDAYRVADMIHQFHVDESLVNEMNATTAHQMSPMELLRYQSAVPIGEPSELVGVKVQKAAQNFGRSVRRFFGAGKEKLSNSFQTNKSQVQHKIVLLSNKNTLTSKVYLEKGQLRQLVYEGAAAEAKTAKAGQEGNRIKISEAVVKQFLIEDYYFPTNTITPLLPRSLQRLNITARIKSANQTREFQTVEPQYNSLGYFEDARSEYPFGQACICQLEGAPNPNVPVADRKTILLKKGYSLTMEIEVSAVEFGHVLFRFSAATANFQESKMIGDEWTVSQNTYRANVANQKSSFNTRTSPMKENWKMGSVRVFRFDADDIKETSGTSMVGEASDYKTIAPRADFFCAFGDNKKVFNGMQLADGEIYPICVVLMVPMIVRTNHNARRMPKK